MTYIIYGFAPAVRDTNADLAPDQQRLEPSELYRTEDYGEVKLIARDGGLIDARGIFCPLQKIINTKNVDAGDIVQAMPPAARRGKSDLGSALTKGDFPSQADLQAQRNALGLTPLPNNSSPSRGEQPITQDHISKIAEQSIPRHPRDPLDPRTRAGIHRSVPGVTHRQDMPS